MNRSKWFKAMNIAAGATKANPQGESWFRFKNVDNGEKAEIYIYGYIVDEKWDPADPDVTPIDFRDELAKFSNVKNLDIYINSDGGNVFAGMAIYHMLKRHTANVTVYNDGMVASIASVISMAADKIIMPKTAMTLVHKPLIAGCFIANADDFLELAEMLDQVEQPIVEAYKSKTGLSEDQIKLILREGGYMNAEQAVKLGFADAFSNSDKEVNASIDGDNLIVNGVVIDIGNYKDFPKDRFPVHQKKPENKQPDPAPTPEPDPEPNFSYYENLVKHNFTF